MGRHGYGRDVTYLRIFGAINKERVFHAGREMIRCNKEKANDNVLLTLRRRPGYFPFLWYCVLLQRR